MLLSWLGIFGRYYIDHRPNALDVSVGITIGVVFELFFYIIGLLLIVFCLFVLQNYVHRMTNMYRSLSQLQFNYMDVTFLLKHRIIVESEMPFVVNHKNLILWVL